MLGPVWGMWQLPGECPTTSQNQFGIGSQTQVGENGLRRLLLPGSVFEEKGTRAASTGEVKAAACPPGSGHRPEESR